MTDLYILGSAMATVETLQGTHNRLSRHQDAPAEALQNPSRAGWSDCVHGRPCT